MLLLEHEGAAVACSKDLFRAPQRIGRLSRLQPYELARIYAHKGVAVRIGDLLRVISAIERLSDTAAMAGASRRISPIPGCCKSSSVVVPNGQPPPGSSADSAA
jgi:hypothetical protein